MPNPAYLHLISCHIPIIGVPFVLVLLAMGMAAKSADVKRAALLLTVLVGIGTIPVFTSGEGAEEILEERPGVAEALMETHEERAETAAIATWVAAGRRRSGSGVAAGRGRAGSGRVARAARAARVGGPASQAAARRLISHRKRGLGLSRRSEGGGRKGRAAGCVEIRRRAMIAPRTF
jgi:hypothetical protein